MKKNIICLVICGVLSLAFLAGGIFALAVRDQKKTENEEQIKKLRQEQAQLIQNSPKEELALTQSGNEKLQMNLETLEDECADLETANQNLQQEYDTISTDETNIYYMTILAELQKGMEKVEGYLNDAQ